MMAAEEKEKLKDPTIGRPQVTVYGGSNELRPDLSVAKFNNFNLFCLISLNSNIFFLVYCIRIICSSINSDIQLALNSDMQIPI